MFENLLKLLLKKPTTPVAPTAPVRSEPVSRKVNESGLALIKSAEGLVLEAYPDPASPLGHACTMANLLGRSYRKLTGWEKLSGAPWTIGWGHTGTDVTQGKIITQAQAEELIRMDCEKFEKGVESLVKAVITDNQFAALVSFAYNCGLKNLEGSTLLKMVNAGAHLNAAAEFMKWTKAQGVVLAGLVTRRGAERDLYLKP